MPVALCLGSCAAGCLYSVAFRSWLSDPARTKLARFAAAVPAVVLIWAAPLLVYPREADVVRGLVVWAMCWVCVFKLFALALGTSDIPHDAGPILFTAALILPIQLVPRGKEHEAQAPHLTLRNLLVAWSVCLLLINPMAVQVIKQVWTPTPFQETVLLCGYLWSFLECIFNLVNLISFFAGIRVRPCMRLPIISSSLREFWAQRWNLPTSQVLRQVCYEPLTAQRACVVQPPSHRDHTRNAPSSAAHTPAAPIKDSNHGDQNCRANGSDGGRIRETSSRSSRRFRPAALTGLALAFFISGLVHHVLLCIVAEFPWWDARFALLFWIQPLVVIAQELFFLTAPWQCFVRASTVAARLASCVLTMGLFLPLFWFYMRNPFLENEVQRAFVQGVSNELTNLCELAFPSVLCHWPVHLKLTPSAVVEL